MLTTTSSRVPFLCTFREVESEKLVEVDFASEMSESDDVEGGKGEEVQPFDLTQGLINDLQLTTNYSLTMAVCTLLYTRLETGRTDYGL